MRLTQRNSSFTDIASRTDYGANAGDCNWSEPYTAEPGSVEDVQSGSFKFPEHNTGVDDYGNSAVCYEGHAVKLRQIEDGTSKTYMVGEKSMDPIHYATGQDPSDDWSMFSGHQDDQHRVTGRTGSDGRPKTANIWQPHRDQAGLQDRAVTEAPTYRASTWSIAMAMCKPRIRNRYRGALAFGESSGWNVAPEWFSVNVVWIVC